MQKRGNMGKNSGKVAGRLGTLRSPSAGTLIMTGKPNLHPSIAANTTTTGVSKTAAPLRGPTDPFDSVKSMPKKSRYRGK